MDAHIDAARESIRRKAHFETKLVDTLLEASVTAENDFILEESR